MMSDDVSVSKDLGFPLEALAGKRQMSAKG